MFQIPRACHYLRTHHASVPLLDIYSERQHPKLMGNSMQPLLYLTSACVLAECAWGLWAAAQHCQMRRTPPCL